MVSENKKWLIQTMLKKGFSYGEIISKVKDVFGTGVSRRDIALVKHNLDIKNSKELGSEYLENVLKIAGRLSKYKNKTVSRLAKEICSDIVRYLL